MAGLTLDTGALIAADRNDRRFWAYWKEAEQRDVDITVPGAVLAQAWRGPRNARLSMLLAACVVDSLDRSSATETGALCGRSATSDVIDASVIVGAGRRSDDVLTSDPGDLSHLTAFTTGVGTILDLNRLPT